ncbi:MAG: hypothetical protein ACKOQM_06775 [Novosphingobium sp.]
MKRSLMAGGLALAVLPLAGCYDDYGGGYGYSRPHSYSSYYPRSYGWYDGYYGPVHSGYWGPGGYYYYRMHARDRWRRDEGWHFRRGDRPHGNWRRWDRDDRHDGDHRGGWGRGRDHDDDD